MPAPDDETPLFDPTAIDKLRKVAGDQGQTFVVEMAQLFIDETTKSLSEIRAGCERGDWKVVTRHAHSLKSSAATMGLMRLSSASRALEFQAKSAVRTTETDGLVAAVLSDFEQAIPILKGLSQPPP